ncbi:BZIP family transcription factor [Colletotrichum karsti]|uniref:BZIP family transcription factor n=1 Tax=Colletotrichum karsti TaxID=1095194 RepID=A0A9P6LQC6_9PEZI|nr:BZIP family transcription factor [Colletotrichum karsti]KAF9880562.1 BZIP family transcription factor [Colletotrichum karsti]
MNPPQQQQQPSFSYTSPPESHQSASLTSSSSDSSSFLRHPHDPRLLQAQYEASATSYDLPPDPNFSPTVGDLVPIQLQGLVAAHISQPQPPFLGFSHPDPAGPAPFIPTGDDHDFFHQHRQPGVLQFPGVYSISFMQNPELSILNAESFDDGTGGAGFRAPRSLPPGRSQAVAGDESGRSRKRTKAQSTEGFEQEEEEKKRSRGRPRLDTNDETAKDRRRTQIRLAQRAYRNRKETAIQTLEKQVDQLKNNNEEMSKAFMTLYDFAVSKGMLDTAPDFGRQLQATTEKFVSLARRTSEDPGKDGDIPASLDQESEGHKSSPTSNPEKLNEKSHSPEAAQSNQVLYGGYMVDQDPIAIQQSIPRTHALAAVHTTSWAHDSQALGARALSSQAPLGYEIVTEPTPDNASFPFGMSLESGLDTTGLFDSSGQPPSESPFSLLSAPSTYAYQERTFGRRLQRSTLERAYLLIRMPNPPPHRIAAVFGFCLLFEPRERILERVANRLSVNQNETMFNWRFPFLHLGGGGTFFDEMHNEMDTADLPRFGNPRRPVGNQGTLEPHRQKVDSLYGIGPWDAHTEEMRDSRVTRTLRTSVPGFEGDFYDADEVEWVLQQRGVIIPPAADFVTAEIDPADFPVSDDASVGGSKIDNYITRTIGDPNAFGMNMSVGVSGQSTSSSPSQGVTLESTGTPALDFIGTTASGIPTTLAMSTPMNLDPNLGGDLFGMGSSATSGTSPVSRKRTVTINVGMLVHELGSRSVCLGRSPGVRPKDVNAAFWSSLAS